MPYFHLNIPQVCLCMLCLCWGFHYKRSLHYKITFIAAAKVLFLLIINLFGQIISYLWDAVLPFLLIEGQITIIGETALKEQTVSWWCSTLTQVSLWCVTFNCNTTEMRPISCHSESVRVVRLYVRVVWMWANSAVCVFLLLDMEAWRNASIFYMSTGYSRGRRYRSCFPSQDSTPPCGKKAEWRRGDPPLFPTNCTSSIMSFYAPIKVV